MKKLFFVMLGILIFTGCNYYDYELPTEGIWVCEEPYIVYEVSSPTDTDSCTLTLHSIEVSSGDIYQMEFINRFVYITHLSSDDDYSSERVLTGTYTGDGYQCFSIIVDRENDKLFDGKYKKLHFVNQND